jgi:hypothetical protein
LNGTHASVVDVKQEQKGTDAPSVQELFNNIKLQLKVTPDMYLRVWGNMMPTDAVQSAASGRSNNNNPRQQWLARQALMRGRGERKLLMMPRTPPTRTPFRSRNFNGPLIV